MTTTVFYVISLLSGWFRWLCDLTGKMQICHDNANMPRQLQKCHDNANIKVKTLKCHDNANLKGKTQI